MGKFMKGMLIGGAVGAVISTMSNSDMYNIKKKMMKKGKQMAKKMF